MRAIQTPAMIVAAALLAGCATHSTQLTSGRDYLSGYSAPAPEPRVHTGKDVTGQYATGDRTPRPHVSVDEEVRRIASVEPQLRFPARIGLVRVFDGRLVNIPEKEGEAWSEAREQLGDGFGEFIPVSPLIAEMVYRDTEQPDHHSRYYPRDREASYELIRKIRLGAARQHLDVVLIYEVFSKTRSKRLATAVADLTIIGGFLLPSRKSEATGYANALLLDVRNGYPYGTASAAATEEDIFTTFASEGRQLAMEEKTRQTSTLQLIPEVEKMLRKLRVQVAEKRVQELSAHTLR